MNLSQIDPNRSIIQFRNLALAAAIAVFLLILAEMYEIACRLLFHTVK